jgi:hypothetical protein
MTFQVPVVNMLCSYCCVVMLYSFFLASSLNATMPFAFQHLILFIMFGIWHNNLSLSLCPHCWIITLMPTAFNVAAVFSYRTDYLSLGKLHFYSSSRFGFYKILLTENVVITVLQINIFHTLYYFAAMRTWCHDCLYDLFLWIPTKI